MNINERISQIKNKLKLDKSFDIIGREIKVGNKDAYYVFVDGFANDEILFYIIDHFQNVIKFDTIEDLAKKDIAYVECDVVKNDTNLDTFSVSVLSGMFAVFVDGHDDYILLDCRVYPVRSISESEVEKVIRGSKDSFVETVVFNTALIRRRIKSEKLVFEMEKVGNVAKTDVCIAYMDGIVNEILLNNVKNKLKSINTNNVILSAEYIEDLFFNKRWYNPLPLVKYTERPDVASAHISEGHIVILVDTCPVAVVVPVSVFQFAQHIGDYNIKFINGTIVKFCRFISIFNAIALPAIFIYLAEDTKVFSKLAKKGDVADEILLSYFHQIFVLEIAFLMLQVSSINIPTQLTSLIGIIGGLLLSDMAIKMGILTPMAILCMAITVISTYSIPSIEFTDALRIFRLFMIVSAGVFGIYGLVLSFIAIVIMAVTTETLTGANPYMYPLIPFNFKDLKGLLIRENARDIK